MNKVKYLCIIASLFLINIRKVEAYQSDITDDEVEIQEIVKHFNGDLRLERDSDGEHYAEYIFDGKNITIKASNNFVLIDGVAAPYKTIEKAGVLLPKPYKIRKIWGTTMIPVELLVRTFDYKVVGDKLVYDEPLGTITEDEVTAMEEEDKVSKKQDDALNNEEGEEINTEVDSSPPVDKIPKRNEPQENSQDVGSDKNETDSGSEEAQVETDTEADDNKHEEEEEGDENKDSDELQVNTFKILNNTFQLGKHYHLKASHLEKQEYIREGNILTSWSEPSVNRKKATLIVGQGNTSFKEIQGKLKIDDTIHLVDSNKKERQYTIKEHRKAALTEVEDVHDELYEEFKDTNSIVLQFQELEQTSFYLAI